MQESRGLYCRGWDRERYRAGANQLILGEGSTAIGEGPRSLEGGRPAAVRGLGVCVPLVLLLGSQPFPSTQRKGIGARHHVGITGFYNKDMLLCSVSALIQDLVSDCSLHKPGHNHGDLGPLGAPRKTADLLGSSCFFFLPWRAQSSLQDGRGPHACS